MRYTGIQPQYFPRLHYFARILQTDLFMIRDDVQFVIKHKYPDGKTDKSYQAHTSIKQSFGRHLMAIPIKHQGYNPIGETMIFYDDNWSKDHLKSLEICYSKSPNFKRLYPEIEKLLKFKYQSLADLNIATILWTISYLTQRNMPDVEKLSLEDINKILKNQKLFRLKEIRKASESKILKQKANLGPNEKILALIQEIEATEDYCGGTSVAAYVDHDMFEKNNIKITVQDWKCLPYPQLFEKQQGFIPNLSIIDLVMNVPKEKALKILTS